MSPVIRALGDKFGVDSLVCSTGQHRQMLDQVTRFFGIVPDFDLNIMRSQQDLFDVTSNVLLGVRDVLRETRPDVVCVHGDTTTCLASSLAAFYEGIPVAHVEAGLRTGDFTAPFPEEANRVLVSRIAKYHFAPTKLAKNNLLKEGVNEQLLSVTGNTVIDALLWARDKIHAEYGTSYWRDLFGGEIFDRVNDRTRRMVLITAHRRESFGAGFEHICDAIEDLAKTHPDVDFIYPVHLNPNVREPVFRRLGRYENVLLIEPQEYAPFVWLMDRSHIILTDSGGIQEEAPSLNKPVFVLRGVTERPEALNAGTVKLVGTDPKIIISNVNSVLRDVDEYQKMANAVNPFGDGTASIKIVNFLSDRFSI